MAVRTGYKRTDVGVIPEDWRVEPLGNYVRITSGESPSQIKFTTSGLPYFKVEQLSNSVKYLVNSSTPYHFCVGKTVPRGSIIFAKRGAAIALNKVRLLADESFMDTNLMALTPISGLLSEFLFYALGYVELGRLADTTSVPQINNKHIKPLLFALPSEMEQRAIATALSDIDALLDTLEKLIAKKRDLKQAAMQQLLTGQSRLSGFQGEWEVRPLASVIAGLDAGVSVNSIEYSMPLCSGEPCILKTSAIVDGCFDPEECKLIDRRDINRARLSPRRDTIIISRMNTPNLVGEVGYVTDDFPTLHLPDRLWLTRFDPNSDICARWLAYVMSSAKVKERIKGLATGTSGSMKNISKDKLLALQLEFPTAEEQIAIATVLSDMDADLSALEQRLAKTRALKQGMMQELLTGRTRLV